MMESSIVKRTEEHRMSEFIGAVRGRVGSARHTVRPARANDDCELADLHEADLRHLERLAREHGIDLGDEPTAIRVPRLAELRAEDCPS
jgi:hypothetical protein